VTVPVCSDSVLQACAALFLAAVLLEQLGAFAGSVRPCTAQVGNPEDIRPAGYAQDTVQAVGNNPEEPSGR
jgi:hypothetical protein